MRNTLLYLVIGGLVYMSMSASVFGAPKAQNFRSEMGIVNFAPNKNQLVVSDRTLRFDEETIIVVDQFQQRLAPNSLREGMLVNIYRARGDSGLITRIEVIR